MVQKRLYGVLKPIGFSTGREFDKETGLYYYRARYYDPMEGRFVSKDPIGYKGGINIYAYTNNNPLNFTDATGLSADCCKQKVEDTYNQCLKSFNVLDTGLKVACVAGGVATFFYISKPLGVIATAKCFSIDTQSAAISIATKVCGVLRDYQLKQCTGAGE